MSRALIAGSFDPVTLGHIDLVERALALFDEVHVVIFINPNKRYTFSCEERLELLHLACEGYERVRVDSFEGLVTEYMARHDIDVSVRCVRNASDYSYEHEMALANDTIREGTETVLLTSRGDKGHISSAMVRELIAHGGDYSRFVPDAVAEQIRKMLDESADI